MQPYLYFKKGYLVSVLSALWLSGCNSGSTTPSPTPKCNPCTMFYAGNNGNGYNADLLSQAESLGATNITTGIAGADYICEYEALNQNWHPNLPQNRQWKAMIADGQNRVACSSPNCSESGIAENVNWVLYPFTNYQNESLQYTSTTNESAIITNWPTTQNIIYGGPKTQVSANFYTITAWLGISINWISDPINNCTKWTSPRAESIALTGLELEHSISHSQPKYLTNLNSDQAHGGSTTLWAHCNSNHRIYHDSHSSGELTFGLICVQQN